MERGRQIDGQIRSVWGQLFLGITRTCTSLSCKVGKLCARSRLNVLSLRNNIADHRTRKRTNSIFALFRPFHPWHRVIDVRWSSLFYFWTVFGYRYGKIFAYVLLKMKICIILLLNYFEIVLIEHLPNDSNESIHMIHGINTFFFFFFLWIRKGNDKIIQYNN